MVLLALNRNEMTGLGLCSLINLRVGKGETPFEPPCEVEVKMVKLGYRLRIKSIRFLLFVL